MNKSQLISAVAEQTNVTKTDVKRVVDSLFAIAEHKLTNGEKIVISGFGVFSVADVVLLQKYLLGESDTVLSDWKAADLYTDNQLDVFDFIAMRELLV